jgi:cytochrome P450 family 9
LFNIKLNFKISRITGLFEFRYPAFFARDPELIKRLAIKEFDNFTDRRMIIDEEVEPIFGKTVFGMRGQKWKGDIINYNFLPNV